MSGWLVAGVIIGALAVTHVPLGDHIARSFSTGRHWRVERWVYRVAGVDPEREQPWAGYLRSVLAFSLTGIVGLYLLLRLQSHLPGSTGHAAVSPVLALNTAVSFVTNTSWQSYAGESTMGHLALAVGLGVQAFLSAAVGLCVAMALIRAIARGRTTTLGSFWVDLTRACTRVLLPLALVGGLLLLAGGVVESLASPHLIHTLGGGRQSIGTGPVAAWEPIKLLSGDGGGAFNANSGHPFESPSSVTTLLEVVLMLLVPAALIRTYGVMVGDRRQGWALAAVAGTLLTLSLVVTTGAQTHPSSTVSTAVGAASEGTEVRNGPALSALFGASATSSADGAAAASYDSFTALGGGALMATMMLGEVSPGGVGSGLYGLLILALLATFLAGLMVGRTPEYLGKKLQRREITFISLYTLATPAALLIGAAVALAFSQGRASLLGSGSHGLSEAVYAMTSAANSNGSAFAGLNANTNFWNVSLTIVMLVGRYLPIVFVLGLAGSLARQERRPVTRGTLPTHTATFTALVIGVALVVTLLSYLPALALGPLAEAFS